MMDRNGERKRKKNETRDEATELRFEWPTCPLWSVEEIACDELALASHTRDCTIQNHLKYSVDS